MRLFLLGFFLLPLAGLAQNKPARSGQVSGFVIDSVTKKPLMEANVSVLLARDSSFVQVQTTGGDGDFSVQNLALGRYRLLITYVGYRPKSVLLTLTAAQPTVSLDTIRVLSQTQTLNEVVVVQERPPVSVKGDTLEFNAGSFKTQPNAQVEDLLKKLPGMEVDRDGNVKAQGQDVRRVLVDGKPFFGNDPKMATRNLPADMIERVQVFDRQSEQSQFSGVDDGERDRTVNLVTKRDRRRGVFGQQSAGYGTDEAGNARYQARLSVNRFNNGQQLSGVGQLNNINQQNFTGDGLGNGPTGGGGGQGGGGQGGGGQGGGSQGGGGIVGSNASGLSPTGITRALAGGLNFSDAIGTKVDISTSYFYNQTNTQNEQTSRRETTLPNSATAASQTNFTDKQNGSGLANGAHRINLQLNYRLDSANSIRLIPNLSFTNNQTSSLATARTVDGQGALLNTSNSSYTNNVQGVSGTNTLLWMHKFKRRGRTFSANLITTINDQNSNGLNQSQNQFLRSVGGQSSLFASRIDQQNRQTTNALTNNLTVSYTEPLSLAKSIEFRYTMSHSDTKSDRQVYDFKESTRAYDLVNNQLTNKYANVFATQRGGVSYQFRRVKYQYTIGVDAQNATLQSNNLSRDTTLNRSFFNVLPSARFQYNLGRNRNVTLDYRTRVNAPSVSQLQPIVDNSNPLYIRRGNPDLRPELSHVVNLNYRTYDQTTFHSFVASLNVTQTQNRIVNATTISPSGAQEVRPINANGYYSLFGFMNISKPAKWGAQTVNVSWSTNLQGSRSMSFLNDRANTALNLSLGQGLSLNTNINEKTDLNLSGNVTYQVATYSVQPQQNTRFFTNTANLRAFHRFGNRLFVQTDVYYIANSGRSAGYNQQYVLLNASLGQYLFKQKQGELRITAFDLLNQNRSVTRTTTESYVDDVQSLVLRRYFMVSFNYSIRHFAAMKL
ncbi:outer membrane beta-barrel protein [Fibrella sp. HMF5335]|uniref:Outer membrane beta-barrel protein n=1 Tax=Fibrella rubiginis TaxID=2817060 RepID=A0A939K4F4_9BACT|nr:outer membrane beta-barrel family protein [Fibrella rubiginis]MBO0938364.1 outer membrane beta-barrel protein [Fibrella rubiginis]